MLKNFITVFKYLIVSLTLLMFSCEDENFEPQVNQSLLDLKSQLDPASSQNLPSVVQKQLELTSENLNKYMNSELQIEDINVLGELSTEKSLRTSHLVVSDQASFVASGNIMEPSSVIVGEMQKLYPDKKLNETKDAIMNLASQELKIGDKVLEITWKNGNETFKTQCFYRNSGIVWDNVLAGLFMMNPEAHIEESKLKVSSKWYKKWWTVYWIWGSKRGEMGYKITIYYSGSTVSNTDVEDWAYITLGTAKSYSKIVTNSGSYGKCQYALGLCTPVGSLSFDYKNFKVSFSGLGSNIVANGYKSLYP